MTSTAPPVVLVGIVRPFQFLDVRPVPSYTRKQAPADNPDEDIVEWGSSGNDIFALQANVKQELPKPIFEEVSRRYDVVRVTNPDDPTQHLDTEEMREYRGRNTVDQSLQVLRFAPTPPSENVSILSENNVRKQPDPNA